MDAPIAPKRPSVRELHGETFVDDYAWLRDRDDPETIAYLEAENEYTEARQEHLADMREAIFGEIKSRVLEDDISAPAKRGEWWYASETHEGSQYPTLVRMRGGPDGERHVTLDRAMWGSDQAASVEPHGMRTLVKYIRVTEKSMGDGEKQVYESEQSSLQKLRRYSE